MERLYSKRMARVLQGLGRNVFKLTKLFIECLLCFTTCFTSINLLHLQNNPIKKSQLESHLTNETTEAQRSSVSCPDGRDGSEARGMGCAAEGNGEGTDLQGQKARHRESTNSTAITLCGDNT